MVAEDEMLKASHGKYTAWLDEQLEVVSANVDQSVDQEAKINNFKTTNAL